MTKKQCDMNKLNFSIDRILSEEPTKHKNSDTSRAYSAPDCSVLYPYLENYGASDILQNYTNFQYLQPSDFQMINTPFTNSLSSAFGNCSGVIRPAPVRPVLKEAPRASSGTTSQIENNCRRRSWSRAVFSSLQRKGLEKRFAIQKYITKPDRRQLAATLGLTDAQVKVWFQNRRMKWRHTKEAEKRVESDISGTSKDDQLLSNNQLQNNKDEKNSDDEEIDVESNI